MDTVVPGWVPEPLSTFTVRPSPSYVVLDQRPLTVPVLVGGATVYVYVVVAPCGDVSDAGGAAAS
jgi:hypothetical protein